jgi:hypothetical protein
MGWKNTGLPMSQNINHACAPPLSQMLFGDNTPKKAFLTALVVGTILTAINHGDVILGGSAPSLLKVALTYCVPYCVTTWGAMMGKRSQWLRDEVVLGNRPVR